MSNLPGRIILVIDDDPRVLELVEYTFSQSGAKVYTAASGEEGLAMLATHKPDLVILDVMMPEMDGWQVCCRMRQVSNVPIIFLTALDGDDNIIQGLNGGAVDYVIKPFSPEVLLARARAALRKAALSTSAETTGIYADDYLTIDLEERRVLVRGEPVKLTAIEFELLAYLVLNAGRVCTFQQILDNVWGWEYRDCVNYVDGYIWHLRRKLEEDPKNPRYLLSMHGVGYRFQ